MRIPILTAVVALPALVLVAFVARYGIVVPYWDQWELVPVLDRYYAGDLGLADLWAQHNAHRIFFPRCIMVFWAGLSHWSIRYELATNVVLGFAIFGAWCALLVITKRRDPGLDRFPWVFAGSIAIFSMAQWRNWLWGWQLQIFLVVAAALWVIVLLTLYRRRWPFAAAVGSAVVATFSFAAGLAVWPAGVVVLALLDGTRREKGLALAVWMACGAAATGLYLWGFEVPADAHGPGTDLWGVVSALTYVFAFVGGGLWNAHAPVALGLGVFGVIASGICAARLCATRETRQRAAPFIALSVFVLTSAVIASAGRSGEGIGQAVESRYSTFSGLFWIALIVLFDMTDRRRFTLGAWHRPTPLNVLGIPIICFVVAIGLAANSIHGANAGSQRGAYYNSLGAVLVEGGDADDLRHLYPDVETLRERRSVLGERGLSVFHGVRWATP